MRITEIETLPVSVGPGYEYAVILVLVRTDEGLTGIGEASLAGQGTLVVSILAGKTLANLRAGLPHAGAIVRAMPNLPASVGRGATGVAGEPGLTALITAALVRTGVPSDNPVVAKALKFLEGKVQKDGGVYDRGLSNYMTCLAVMTFKEANAGGKYDKIIENAVKYVKSLQFADGLTEDNTNYGGAGYDKPGPKGRPDMSNTQFMVEALLAGGVKKDDPVIARALTYISRSQNLESEFN